MFKKQLLLLLGAKTFSDFGFAFDFICFSIFVWTATLSPFAVGCLSAAFYGGGILGGKIVHRYGDGWDRKQAMIAADLFRMGMLIFLVLLPSRHQLLWLYPTVFVIGCGRAVFESTLAASLPVMSDGRLQWVNSLAAGLRSGALVVGMLFAAATVKALGYRFLFFIDAVTYGLSAIVLLTLSLPFRETASPNGKQKMKVGRKNFEFFRGVGFSILLLLSIRALDAFGSGTHHVGLPILGSQIDPLDAANVLGSIWGVWGVGMFLGSFVIRPLIASQIDRKSRLVFLAATALMSAGFVGIFWASDWPGVLFCAGLAGIGDGLSEIAFRQTLQRADDTLRGGLFGFSEMMVNAGFITGMPLTGWFARPSTIAQWVLLLHGVPLLASILGVGILVAFSVERTVKVKA